MNFEPTPAVLAARSVLRERLALVHPDQTERFVRDCVLVEVREAAIAYLRWCQETQKPKDWPTGKVVNELLDTIIKAVIR